MISLVGFGEAERQNRLELPLFLVECEVIGIVAVVPRTRVEKGELALAQQINQGCQVRVTPKIASTFIPMRMSSRP